MSKQFFRVVFHGQFTGEFDEATVRENIRQMFHLDDGNLDDFFSGKPCLVKKKADKAQALQYKSRLTKAGCKSTIEMINRQPVLSPEPEAPPEEKRVLNDRRMKHRRSPRPGALVPDRRLKIRREKDRLLFDELVAKDRPMPMPLRYYSKTISNVQKSAR